MPRFNYVAVLDRLPGLRLLDSVEAADEDEAFDWFLKNRKEYTLVDLWNIRDPWPRDVLTKPPMDYG